MSQRTRCQVSQEEKAGSPAGVSLERNARRERERGAAEDVRLLRPVNTPRRAWILLARQQHPGNARLCRLIAEGRSSAKLQREEEGTQGPVLPPLPRLELPAPSLLGPRPEPFPQVRLEVPALTLSALEEQLDPETIRSHLLQLSLESLAAAPAPGGGPAPTGTAPSEPEVPVGPGPERPRAASTGDLLRALVAVPAVEAALNQLRTLALERVRADWRRLSAGERVAAVSTMALVAGGAVAGILSNPEARATALQELAGRTIPVPGVPGFRLQLDLSGDQWLVGLHLDLGALLPAGLGFAPSSPTPLPEAPSLRREARLPPPDQLPVGVAQEIEQQLSRGRPLEPQVAAMFAQRLGCDLSEVRIHTDAEADRLNREVSAHAFTIGKDIFFRAGSYRPDTREGERLLLHELVHVLQQDGEVGRVADLKISAPDDPFERVAEALAEELLKEGGAQPPPAIAGPLGLQRVVARIGPYAPATYGELLAIARTLASDLEERLAEVPPTERVHQEAMQWIHGVEAWRTALRGREEEELSEAAAAQAQLWWEDLGRLRAAILRYQQDRIVGELRSVQGALAEEAAALEGHRDELDEALRAAFLRNDEDAIANVANFVGTALDIGLGLQELSRDIASAIADARGATIPEASRYTRWLGRINRILTAANLLYSLAQESPPTELGRALAQVNTLAGAFSAGTTLLSLAPHIGLYANLYLVPAVQVIVTSLDRILGRHLHELNIVAAATGFMVDMSNEPGGWPLFYFMFDVMHAGSPEEVPYPVPSEVERFLLSRREVISAGARPEEGRPSEMPTTGWWFWRRLDRARIQEWVFQNRRSLWAMFYGSMEVPRAEQIPWGRR